jgi:hypothetical protein
VLHTPQESHPPANIQLITTGSRVEITRLIMKFPSVSYYRLSLTHPNTILSTLLQNTISLFSSLRHRYRVSHKKHVNKILSALTLEPLQPFFSKLRNSRINSTSTTRQFLQNVNRLLKTKNEVKYVNIQLQTKSYRSTQNSNDTGHIFAIKFFQKFQVQILHHLHIRSRSNSVIKVYLTTN